jgi:monoamine oxidase
VRDHVSEISLRRSEAPRREDDLVSIDQYVRKLGALPSTITMVNLWTQVMHGVESTEESAAFFIDYCRRVGGFPAIRGDDETGGNYLRIVEGEMTRISGHQC